MVPEDFQAALNEQAEDAEEAADHHHVEGLVREKGQGLAERMPADPVPGHGGRAVVEGQHLVALTGQGPGYLHEAGFRPSQGSAVDGAAVEGRPVGEKSYRKAHIPPSRLEDSLSARRWAGERLMAKPTSSLASSLSPKAMEPSAMAT